MLKRYAAAMIVAATMLHPTSYAFAQQEGKRISPARAVAIHECSVVSQRYAETTFASLEYELYRACMARNGQVE